MCNEDVTCSPGRGYTILSTPTGWENVERVYNENWIKIEYTSGTSDALGCETKSQLMAMDLDCPTGREDLNYVWEGSAC